MKQAEQQFFKKLETTTKQRKKLREKREKQQQMLTEHEKLREACLESSKEAIQILRGDSNTNLNESVHKAAALFKKHKTDFDPVKSMSRLKELEEPRKLAEQLRAEGSALINNKKYSQGREKLTKGLRLVDNTSALKESVSIRTILIQSAVAFNDIETALIHTINLDETICKHPLSFKLFTAPTYSGGIDPRFLYVMYLTLAEGFLYIGDLAKAEHYLNKICEQTQPDLKQESSAALTDTLESVKLALEVLLPRQKKLSTKCKVPNNLSGIVSVFMVLETECIDLIKHHKFDEFTKLFNSMLKISTIFSIYKHYVDKKSEVWQSYQKLCNQEVETKLHIAQQLLTQFHGCTDQALKKRLEDQFVPLFLEVLTYVQQRKHDHFIYLTSTLLAEYYHSKLIGNASEDVLDNPFYNEYIQYLKLRDDSLLKINNQKPKPKKENIKDEAITFLDKKNNETNKNPQIPAEVIAYQEWQDAYNRAAAAITTTSLDIALSNFEDLLKKYSAPHQQAQIHFGIAECYYFNNISFKPVLAKIEHKFNDLLPLQNNSKKALWRDVENLFANTQATFDSVTHNLEVALQHINICAEHCVIYNEKNKIHDKIELNDMAKLLDASKNSSTKLMEFTNSIQSVNKNFIHEMMEKKKYLTEIGKYGKKNKHSDTSELVRFSMRQDEFLNKIRQNADVLEKKASELQQSVDIKSKSLGLWFATRADQAIKIYEYESAYNYYIEARNEFKKVEKISLLASAEHKLSWIQATKADLTTDLNIKKELLISSIEHAKSALNAYRKSGTGIVNYEPQIEALKKEIAKYEESQMKLDAELRNKLNPSP